MRMIDADTLIADLEHDVAIDEDMLDYEEMTEDRREIIQFDKDCKQNAIDLLNHAPTIEPKRGRWLKLALANIKHTYVCSVCGRMLVNITDDKNMVTKNYPFCHCGADMREGEANG